MTVSTVTTPIRAEKKLVFLSKEVPANCVKRAQVAVIAKDSWHLIAPWPYRTHGMSAALPMPALTCPIVDIRGVKDEAQMVMIVKQCIAPYAGVINMDGLLTGLEALGAKVQRVAKKEKQ